MHDERWVGEGRRERIREGGERERERERAASAMDLNQLLLAADYQKKMMRYIFGTC